MNMLKWLRTREPQPGRDCSVTLPTTATTNQFIDPDEREKLQKLFDDVCDQRRDALAEVDRLRERVKELEAEVEKRTAERDECIRILDATDDRWIAKLTPHRVDAERLRKAIGEAVEQIKKLLPSTAREILESALSPSPAAASEPASERIKELEAELADWKADTADQLCVNCSDPLEYQERADAEAVKHWSGIVAKENADAERLRKAIEEALHAQQHRGLKVAREILKAALSPSPAAENKSNGSQSPHKPATRPQANEAEPAAATEAIVSGAATDPAGERIKELEAEVERLTELYQEDTVTTWNQKQEVERQAERIKELEAERQLSLSVEEALSAIDRALLFFRQGDRSGCDGMNEREISLASTAGVKVVRNAFATEQSMHSAWRKRATEAESDAERLRKAIVRHRTHYRMRANTSAYDDNLELWSALTPSPAAASGEKPMVFENCTIEKFPASAPAAESEPTACSDRGVFAESGAAKVVCDLEREICELTRRLATCEERLGRTEQERDAAIVKCNAASQKIAAWRGLIREQRAKITALEKKQGIEERTPGPVFDVTHAENRVLPPEFQLSKIAKDWVVDPRVQASGHAGHRPGTIPGRQGFLKLGVRARKTLIRLNIQTVGQLMQYTSQELLAIKNTGISTLREIQEALAACDLYLLDDPRRK